MRKVTLIALGCMFLDQIIKSIVVLNFSFEESVIIIKNFFNITLVQNTGAAFSILSSNTLFLILVSLGALALIYFFFIKDKKLSNFENILYGALMGGIIGNLIDRIFRGYVIDYLDFNLFGYNFPVFNLADIFITLSIILLIIVIIKGEGHEVSSK